MTAADIPRGTHCPACGQALRISKPPKEPKYPFRQMAVGDSFHAPCRVTYLHNFRALASVTGCRYGMKFKIRKDGESYVCTRVR